MTLTTHARSSADQDHDAAWPVLHALSPEVSQRVFRACLDALARPGSGQRLPNAELPDGVPPVALVPLALTDLMAPLAGLGLAAGLARRIATATGSRFVDPEQSRFALALDDSGELERLPIGSNWSPELGAMLCQRVAGISHDDLGLSLTLTGPGIKDLTKITVAGLSTDFFAVRAELTADFPTGIDLLLITDEGTMIGLPRTTRIEVG